MGIGLVRRVFAGVILRCDIYLAPNNRLNSRLPCRFVKIDNTVHITVVGNSKTVHTQVFGLVN